MPSWLLWSVSYTHLQGRRAGSQRHLYAFRRGVFDQLENIFPLQRIAARKHKNRHAHIGDLIDQILAFGVAQFIGMRNRLRRRTACLLYTSRCV